TYPQTNSRISQRNALCRGFIQSLRRLRAQVCVTHLGAIGILRLRDLPGQRTTTFWTVSVQPIPRLEGEARTCLLNLSKKLKSRQALMAPSMEEQPAVSSTSLLKAAATTFTATFLATARAKGSSARSRIFPSRVLPQTVLQKRILAETPADRSRRTSSGSSAPPIRNGERTTT